MTVGLDYSALQRWRAEPAAFIESALHDPETGRPYRLLTPQRLFLQHAFLTDANGRLRYPELLYCCPKKSGKTGFGALFALTTALLFGGAYPEVICAANDYDQAQGRVFEAIRKIVECSPMLQGEARVTANKISLFGTTITAIPNDYAGQAGGNPTISVFDELWAYQTESSRRLWDELVPPPTRQIACRLTVSYAGFSSESVLLEELHNRGRAQPCVGPDLYAGDGMLMYWTHDFTAPWQTAEWREEMRRSLRPNQYLRMIENRFTSTDDNFIDVALFDACVDPDLHPVVADKSLPIWVGIDASVRRDSTAIVATTWDDKSKRVRLIWHRIFVPSKIDEIDFEQMVEQTVLDLRQRFLLRKCFFDPYQMQGSAQRLRRLGVNMTEYPQTLPNITRASQNLFELLKSGGITLYRDDDIRLAIQRSVAIESARGWKIDKAKTSHRIDVVVAMAMACLGAVKWGQRDDSLQPLGLPVSIDLSDERVYRAQTTAASDATPPAPTAPSGAAPMGLPIMHGGNDQVRPRRVQSVADARDADW